MKSDERVRSTATQQRQVMLRSATVAFARNGYVGTPVSDVASEAGLSQGYVLRLFGTKLNLFVAVVEKCFDEVIVAFENEADSHDSDIDGGALLDALGDRYASLIARRELLMIQVHAQSASDLPEVRSALRAGMERIVTFLRERTGAAPEAIQRFIAYGLLCHLIVTADLDDLQSPYAQLLTAGMTHVR